MTFEKTATYGVQHFWDSYSVPSKIDIGTPIYAYYVGGDVVFRADHISQAADGFILKNSMTGAMIWADADDYIYVAFAPKGGK